MKCHYHYSKKYKKVFFIPGCWGTIYSFDMADCHCSIGEHQTFAQFEKEMYNTELAAKVACIKEQASHIAELEKENRELAKAVKRVARLPKTPK